MLIMQLWLLLLIASSMEGTIVWILYYGWNINSVVQHIFSYYFDPLLLDL